MMKLWDIAKTVGSAALQIALPGTGSLIIGAVNEFLPDDKKLPAGATGDDINSAIAGLPPEKQAALMEKEFDVEITQIKESNSTLRTMLESDAKNPHSTRPYIARRSFQLVASITLAVTAIWAYGVVKQDVTLITAVMDGWPFVASLVAPFVTLLWAYFGILKREHKDRLDAAGGTSTPTGIAGILSSIIKRG